MDDARLRSAVQRHRLHVAIDGPAGAGKSTVGRGVARYLEAAFLDTGLMYRAVAWIASRKGVAPGDVSGLTAIAQTTTFASSVEDGSLLVNGQPLERQLRSAAVDAVVSEVSAHREVREVLVEEQRRFADDRSVVMVGRDIGTVVLPEAPVKLWVTASPEERAGRRLTEGLAGSQDVDVVEMAARIRARDELDASRPVSPLRRAPDAVVLDTDDMGEGETVEAALSVIRGVVGRLESSAARVETGAGREGSGQW